MIYIYTHKDIYIYIYNYISICEPMKIIANITHNTWRKPFVSLVLTQSLEPPQPIFHVQGFWCQKHVFQLRSRPKTGKGSPPCLKMKKHLLLSFLQHQHPKKPASLKTVPKPHKTSNPQLQAKNIHPLLCFWVPRTLRMAASTKLIAACWSWAASTAAMTQKFGCQRAQSYSKVLNLAFVAHFEGWVLSHTHT